MPSQSQLPSVASTNNNNNINNNNSNTNNNNINNNTNNNINNNTNNNNNDINTNELDQKAFERGFKYNAKYIGTMEVPRPISRLEIVSAMRRIRYDFKTRSVKKRLVEITVSLDGVFVNSLQKQKLIKPPSASVSANQHHTNDTLLKNPIHRIFYVSHDSKDMKIFSYIAKEEDCNVFKCSVFKALKKNQAGIIVKTIGQAFEVSHVAHQAKKQERLKELMKKENNNNNNTNKNNYNNNINNIDNDNDDEYDDGADDDVMNDVCDSNNKNSNNNNTINNNDDNNNNNNNNNNNYGICSHSNNNNGSSSSSNNNNNTNINNINNNSCCSSSSKNGNNNNNSNDNGDDNDKSKLHLDVDAGSPSAEKKVCDSSKYEHSITCPNQDFKTEQGIEPVVAVGAVNEASTSALHLKAAMNQKLKIKCQELTFLRSQNKLLQRQLEVEIQAREQAEQSREKLLTQNQELISQMDVLLRKLDRYERSSAVWKSKTLNLDISSEKCMHTLSMTSKEAKDSPDSGMIETTEMTSDVTSECTTSPIDQWNRPGIDNAAVISTPTKTSPNEQNLIDFTKQSASNSPNQQSNGSTNQNATSDSNTPCPNSLTKSFKSISISLPKPLSLNLALYNKINARLSNKNPTNDQLNRKRNSAEKTKLIESSPNFQRFSRLLTSGKNKILNNCNSKNTTSLLGSDVEKKSKNKNSQNKSKKFSLEKVISMRRNSIGDSRTELELSFGD